MNVSSVRGSVDGRVLLTYDPLTVPARRTGTTSWISRARLRISSARSRASINGRATASPAGVTLTIVAPCRETESMRPTSLSAKSGPDVYA